MTKQSRLEDLPDEILIEICLYLNSFDILHSFGRLNWRLQCTISEFRSQFDLTFYPLDQFQYFCSPSFLNFVSERLIKLSISNEWSTDQIGLFEKAIGDICFKTKLPMLKSITLGDFINDNVSILPKLLHLEELSIALSSHEKINSTTECLIAFYVFTAQNNFRKVRLSSSHGIQLKSQTQPNTHLKELSIQIATVEDLLVLFTLAPCLIQLEATMLRHAPPTFIAQDRFSVDVMPQFLTELYLYTMEKQVMPFKTLQRMMSYIPTMEYLALGIKTDDSDYADAILWADMITSLPHLTTLHLGLEIEISQTLFYRFGIEATHELKETVFNTFVQNINLFSFIIYTNRQTLFIDSVPFRFNRDQSYTTSPEFVRALCNNSTIAQQPPHHLVGLLVNGEHEPIPSKDYLSVISRFSSIKWLFVDSINVSDEMENADATCPIILNLEYLKVLYYFRSSVCKVNRSLFDRLFYGHERLDTLKMMYGDLIYLLRTASPAIDGNHIKHLSVYCNGADGPIRLTDLVHFIVTFPELEHLAIEVTSIKLMKNNQTEIIEELITSFKQLRSFRIFCQRGTLKLARTLMNDEQSRLKWLAHVSAIGSHLTLHPKSLVLWKSDNQITYF
jgi:hypothetical protein